MLWGRFGAFFTNASHRPLREPPPPWRACPSRSLSHAACSLPQVCCLSANPPPSSFLLLLVLGGSACTCHSSHQRRLLPQNRRRPHPHDAGGVDCAEGRCTTRHFTFDRMLWGCFRASSACQLALLRFPPPLLPHAAPARLRRSKLARLAPSTPPLPASHDPLMLGGAGPQAVGPIISRCARAAGL